MSINNVECPAEANAAAKLIAVVVLPTPPFWLAMQIVRGTKHPARLAVIVVSFRQERVYQEAARR